MLLYIYLLLIFLPAIFLIHRSKKELTSVAILIILFLLVNGLFVTGKCTVSHDSMAWFLLFNHVKELLQNGNLIGWNPYFNSGEPLYLYHHSYALWQWFFFILLNIFLPIDAIILFNIVFIFLFIFYNIGCYLFFQKLFKDVRVTLFCFAVSLFSTSFIMFFTEHSSFYTSIYFPFLLYFFLEYTEKQNGLSLIILSGLIGIASNIYLPHIFILPFITFVAVYLTFMEKKYYLINLNKKIIIFLVIGVILLLINSSPVLYVFNRLQNYFSPIRGGNTVDSGWLYGHYQDYNALLTFFHVPPDAPRAILFLGIIPFFLAIIGIFKSKNRFHLAILLTAVIVYFISLGEYSFLYILIRYLPTFSVLRHYVILEVFVQIFVISLAGMGLEYILSCRKREVRNILRILLIFSVFMIYFYFKIYDGYQKFQDLAMYLTLLFLSYVALDLFIQHRTVQPYRFFFVIVLLTALSHQWYFGYYKYKDVKYNIEIVGKLREILKDEPLTTWKKNRNASYNQMIKMPNYSNFEPALNRYELAFWEPIESSLLVNKEYYKLYPLFQKQYLDYFGITGPKVFVTNNYDIIPEENIVKAMMDNYQAYVDEKKVYFSKEDAALLKTFLNKIDKQKLFSIIPEVIKYGPNILKLTVDSPSDAFLIYLQNYDKDWHAYINGQEINIYRVNYTFQAIPIMKGKNTIEFKFKSLYTFCLGMNILGTLLTLIFMVVFFYKESNRAGDKI